MKNYVKEFMKNESILFKERFHIENKSTKHINGIEYYIDEDYELYYQDGGATWVNTKALLRLLTGHLAVKKIKSEIKPCPFCGNKGKLINTSHSYKEDELFVNGFVVKCVDDDCITGRNYDMRNTTFGYTTREQAIEAWNKRV